MYRPEDINSVENFIIKNYERVNILYGYSLSTVFQSYMDN